MFESSQLLSELQCDSRVKRAMCSLVKNSSHTLTSPENFSGCSNRTTWRRQMDLKKNWVFRRGSNVVNRLQKEDLRSRLELYKGLETILRTDSENCEDEALKTDASNEDRSPHEDSALGTSLNGELWGGITAENDAFNTSEETVTESTATVEFSINGEETLQSISEDNAAEMSDWERAEEFHAALGAELDVVREQIASILREGSILFPLELISRLYLRYGRRLPQLYEEYSNKSLLAWLKCNSRLDLDPLIFGL